MILCIGTTPTVQRTMTFGALKIDAVNRAAEVRQTASGKSLNVARTLQTLGTAAIASGFVGGDTGKFMRRDLDSAGVAHDFVMVTPPTRVCTTVIDQAAGTATELIEEPAALGEADFTTLLERVTARMRHAQVLVLSGSLPPGAPQDFYARCVQAATIVKATVILDATGTALTEALPARPTIVKPNRAELAQTLGANVDSMDDLRAAMHRLAVRGPTWVVVTLGAYGAMVTDGRSYWTIPAPQVQVVSPIGSGDAFAAGLASAINDGQKLPEAAVLAVACGTANAMNTPAGHARKEDIDRLAAEIKVMA